MAVNYLDLKFGGGGASGTVTPAPDSIPKSPTGTNFINDGWLSPNIARSSDIPSGGGGGDGLTRVAEIQTADFLAAVNHSYEVSTNVIAEDEGGEGEGGGEGAASDIAITLPASPADRDRVEIFGVNDGDAWFILNANGHAVVYPTGTTEDGVSWVFEGQGFYLKLEFRSEAAGGGDQWHTVNYSPKVLFGSNSSPRAGHIIKTDQDGYVKVVHQSYFALGYGIAPTVAGGASTPYSANPFDLVPVDLSTGNAKVILPAAPLGAAKVLVKIKTAGAGNTCLVEAADNGDSIDWQYSSQSLSAEGDWIELYYNAVDGTWLVVG